MSEESGSQTDRPMPPLEGHEHTGSPVSDRETKTVMLVAEHGDTVRVDGYGEMTVHKRSDTYHGPVLSLTDGEQSYRLIAPGFATDLQLWEAIDYKGDIGGWRCIDEVSAEITDVEPAKVCECGETLSTIRERRAAAVGVCFHE